MSVPLIDTHVHLSSDPLFEEVGEHVQAARRQGVAGWLVPGVRASHWPRMERLCMQYSDVQMAPGLHPIEAAQWSPRVAKELHTLLTHPATVAVGEIGLDSELEVDLDMQEEVFRQQIRLAAEADLPLVIHCRGCWGQLLDILRDESFAGGGVLHGYSGSAEIALQGWKLGFVTGFGGVCTWPRARRVIETLERLPAEAIVLETDAPDLSPHPYRQEPNRPEWLPLVASRVAEVRGWTLELTAQITTDNARRQFPRAKF